MAVPGVAQVTKGIAFEYFFSPMNSMVLPSCEYQRYLELSALRKFRRRKEGSVNNSTHPPVEPAHAEQEIELVERAWAKAVEKNDVQEIGSFLHSDFTFTSPRGGFSRRQQHLADFENANLRFTSVSLEDLEVRVYGDAAIGTTRVSVVGTAKDPMGKVLDVSGPARWTDMFVRKDGCWLSVGRHMSRIVS